MYISAYQRIKKTLAFLSIFALIGTSVPVGVVTAFAQEVAETITEAVAPEVSEESDVQDESAPTEEVGEDVASDEEAGETTPVSEEGEGADETAPASDEDISVPAEPSSDANSASKEDTAVVVNGFTVDTNGVATIDSVALGITYSAPQNSQVQVTFTSLPEIAGSLSIEEVFLTDEQVAQLGALSNVAYDITSSMENGTFSYDLKLPIPEGTADDAQVVFAEDETALDAGDVETVAIEQVEVEAGEQTVAVSELDHFTIFVVTSFEEVQVTDVEVGYNNIWFGVSGVTNYGSVQRVPSGTNGLASSEGNAHALVSSVAADAGPFTRFDGYKNTWTGTWKTEIDVYLDPAWTDGTGFDYSVAANGTDGNHQRDYIFHVAKDTSTGQLLVAGSNNTNYAVREDLDSITNHYVVTSAGWYTLEHVFREQAGALAVDLNLLNAGGSVLFTETRFDAADAIPAEVGGNRYGLFAVATVPGGLPIDNASIEYSSLSLNETTVEVSPDSLEGWSIATTGGGVVDFVTAVGAPIGDGALNLTTENDNNDRAALSRIENIDLSDVTTLKYSTKRGGGFQAEGNAAYRLRIDADGNPATTNDIATLVYEPYWQDGDGDFGPVVNDVWQTWDVSIGSFWAIIPGGNAVAGLTNGAGGPPFYSIDDVLTLHPNAKVTGISVGIGSYNLNYDILVDAVVFGHQTDTSFEVTTYDFTVDTVPPETPTGLEYDGDPVLSCDSYTNINYAYPIWDAVSDAVSYDYQALFNGSVVFSTSFTTNAHPGGTFGGGQNGVWGFQVRSVDGSGNTSAWSPVCEITLDTIVPATPVHVSPADNSTQDFNDFYFEWTDVADIYEYEFQSALNPAVDGNGALINGVWNNKAHGAPDRDFLTDSNIHSYGANGTWYWQVRAIDEAGNMSPWTSPWKLTIDLDGPDPVLVSEILNPVADGDVVSGIIDLEAFYADEDDNNDGVQWAVRQGTCAAGTNTVLGNVDGHSDSFTWDYENFLASFDTTLVANGSYCFVFNPTEDGGADNQRLTRTFTVENEVVDNMPPAVPTGLAWTDSDSGNVPHEGTTDLYAGTASWNQNTEGDFDRYVYKYWNDIGSSPYNDVSTAWTMGMPGITNTNAPGVFNQGQGVHHFCVTAIDTAGNESACSDTFTITYAISDGGGDEEDDLTPITMCKRVGEGEGSVPQSGWGMTLSTTGEGPAYIVTTEEETGCVTVSVDLADGPWTVVEENREGYTQDAVMASQGVVEFIGESDLEMCVFGMLGKQESDEFTLLSEDDSYDCTFVNTQDEVNTDDEPSSFSSGTRVGSRSLRPQGQVLGASTSADADFCTEPYLVDALGYGQDNDPAQVVRLQVFLNDHMNLSLAVTGMFETSTRQAVMDFQLRYAADILSPWGITNATGLVYHTTKKKINELVCAREFPLTTAQLDEINRTRAGILATRLENSGAPQETVAGAQTSFSGEQPAPKNTGSSSDDGTVEAGTDEEDGFFKRVWGSIFDN
jgi:hypothetical protein